LLFLFGEAAAAAVGLAALAFCTPAFFFVGSAGTALGWGCTAAGAAAGAVFFSFFLATIMLSELFIILKAT
jgi:hypothetical protein